jgi:hypothetical protein
MYASKSAQSGQLVLVTKAISRRTPAGARIATNSEVDDCLRRRARWNEAERLAKFVDRCGQHVSRLLQPCRRCGPTPCRSLIVIYLMASVIYC